MANKGLIGVQMSTIAPAKMPHFDAYESMGKLADIGYHCVEISQVPMTAENVAGFRKAIDELGLNVSSCTASTSPMLPGMPGEFLCNPDDYKKIVEDCRKLDCDMLRIGMLPMTCMGNYQKAVDFAKEANEYALKLKEDGIDLYYHNHHVEFVRYDGEFLLDIIRGIKNSTALPSTIRPQAISRRPYRSGRCRRRISRTASRARISRAQAPAASPTWRAANRGK